MSAKPERRGESYLPLAGRLLHASVALIATIAWLSLGMQAQMLIGSRGLLPVATFLDTLAQRSFGFFDAPTLFWWARSDTSITVGVVVGLLLSLFALVASLKHRLASKVGWLVRPALGLMAFLYLSYATAGRVFFGFQWDNLLVECTVIAALTPRRARSTWAIWAIRLLLFKLYFESGIAKAQSYLHDWQDGSAMTFYYETAPIPTRLAWWAHALPEWWHKLESWLTLVWEILVPFAIFGPRRARHVAIAVFTLFQLINISTANYGFFSYLALALNVALLDEHDLQTLRARLRAWLKKPRRPLLTPSETSPSAPPEHATPPQADEQSLPMTVSTERLRTLLHGALFTLYFAVSALDGLASFALKREDAPFASERALLSRFRVANTYHLFGHITRDRVEPEFQVSVDGVWEPLSMHYKPGPVDRAPPFVAPHQPRIDFLLWFYGLSFRQGMPEYVGSLMKKLCVDPKVVSPLFVEPLPDAPEAVRVVFSRYHFTSSANHTGSSPQAWWERTDDVSGRAFACGPLRSQPHLHP